MKEHLLKIKSSYEDFLDNKVAYLNRQYKLGILAAAIILPAVLFFFLFVSPTSKEIKQLEKDNRYLRGEIQKVEAIAGKLAEHKQEMAEVQLRLKAASLLLPKKKEIPTLLTNISEEGTSAGLEFLTFQPRGERHEQFYAVIPVSISVRGSYHKIGSFLDKVSKLNRIVSVTNISLGGPSKIEGEMLLSAGLELVTYRFLDTNTETK